MEAWTKVHGTAAPYWLSGHAPDGTPAKDSHLAIVPLARLGWVHSDGQLLGLAIVPPAQVVRDWATFTPLAFQARRDFRQAVAALGHAKGEETILTLAPRRGISWRWRLVPTRSGAHSLDPKRYLREARFWASTTPVLLDRHLKTKGPNQLAEAAGIVANACTRIGLPVPIQVEVTKHGAISGTKSAWPPGGHLNGKSGRANPRSETADYSCKT